MILVTIKFSLRRIWNSYRNASETNSELPTLKRQTTR